MMKSTIILRVQIGSWRRLNHSCRIDKLGNIVSLIRRIGLYLQIKKRPTTDLVKNCLSEGRLPWIANFWGHVYIYVCGCGYKFITYKHMSKSSKLVLDLNHASLWIGFRKNDTQQWCMGHQKALGGMIYTNDAWDTKKSSAKHACNYPSEWRALNCYHSKWDVITKFHGERNWERAFLVDNQILLSFLKANLLKWKQKHQTTITVQIC